MSYSFPQSSQVPINLVLFRVGRFRRSAACPERPKTGVTNAARPRRRPPPDAHAPPAVRRIGGTPDARVPERAREVFVHEPRDVFHGLAAVEYERPSPVW